MAANPATDTGCFDIDSHDNNAAYADDDNNSTSRIADNNTESNGQPRTNHNDGQRKQQRRDTRSRRFSIRRRKDKSEVSIVMKYVMFIINVLFWLIGLTIVIAGIWAMTQKDLSSSVNKLRELYFDPVVLIFVIGSIIFVIGFFGCIGALRENTIFLLIYGALVLIIFLLLVAGAVLLFILKGWLKEQISSSKGKIIASYRDDTDLQNLMDWIQSDWLQCCGIDDYKDWEQNIYFNCSSPSSEACSVPFSCCLPNPQQQLQNYLCGQGALKPEVSAPDIIYTEGCISKGEGWFQKNLIPVAGIFVGAAVLQILGICMACNLRSDINAQKAKWKRNSH